MFLAMLVAFSASNTELRAQKMYWTDHEMGKIQRANLDGSNVEDLITAGLAEPSGIALDLTTSKMYWTEAGDFDLGNARIQRANLDGSGIHELISELNFANGIALDPSAGKMYWTERGSVRRANLDGSDIEDVLTGLTDWPGALALDLIARDLYVTSINGLILRATMDGSDLETLVDLTIDSGPVGIALDTSASKMYWVEAFPFPKLGCANLDGTAVQFFMASSFDAGGIALDLDARKMYWTAGGAIHRANLDGSDIEDLVTAGLGVPFGIALDLRSVSPAGPSLDIKPASCPTRVNVRSHGSLPAAIVGSESFDVTQVDMTSLLLTRADGVGAAVSPIMKGPGKLGTIADVATPSGELCECTDHAGDGIDDLTLRFSTSELVSLLELNSASKDERLILTLMGTLLDGTPFELSDCIVVRGGASD
jgi:low density lipoprotein receptor-related protein 5/6